MFKSTIDSASLPLPLLSLPPLTPSLFLSLSYSPLSRTSNSVSNGELSRRTVLIPGAIVQPGITPPVVLDCCEHSFFLRSYINRCALPRNAIQLLPLAPPRPSPPPEYPLPPCRLSFSHSSCSPIATGRVVKFGDYLAGNLHRDSDHLNPFPNARIFPPGWPLVSASVLDNGVCAREREIAVKYYGTDGFMSHVRKG